MLNIFSCFTNQNNLFTKYFDQPFFSNLPWHGECLALFAKLTNWWRIPLNPLSNQRIVDNGLTFTGAKLSSGGEGWHSAPMKFNPSDADAYISLLLASEATDFPYTAHRDSIPSLFTTETHSFPRHTVGGGY